MDRRTQINKPMRASEADHHHRGRTRPPVRDARVPLRVLLRVASVACGIQFGWALQLSLLTPYVQELGIPHAWASVIWLCGPLSGLMVQPLVGHMSDRCTCWLGRRRPFIIGGAVSIACAVLIIGHSADIGGLLGDRGQLKPRAIVVFVIGFWLLDVANNMTQGPCRALLADLTEKNFDVCGFDGINWAPISSSSVELLTCPFHEDEVRTVVFKSTGDNAPGPDRYCMQFFQHNRDTLKNDLIKIFHDFYDRGKDHRRTRVANAYFSLFMALGNVLGFATGSFSGWFKIFPFTVTSSCDADCANLKSAFFIDIAFIVITTYISTSAAKEAPLNFSSESHPLNGERPGQSSEIQEAFMWELFGTFRYFSGTIWLILFVTALTWIAWFPFLLFDTDWMGREIYGGKPNEGQNYNFGVRMGALGLMLNSVVLGITSVLMEKLCRKWGAGFIWGISNILMALCFLSMLTITAVLNHMRLATNDLPPDGIVIAALLVFAVLGVPLAITYSVPYALISTRIECLGLGQGLSMGILNLAIVIPQVVVSVGAGPWDQLFGGGNSPAFAVAAMGAFAGGLVAILAIPRSRSEKPRALPP